MINREKRLKVRRRFKLRKRKVQDASKQAEAVVNKHFFRRLNRFLYVRRFVFSWILLVVLMGGGVIVQNKSLTNIYQEETPTSGGSYIEGQLGSFTNANPMYAATDVDKTVSELVFSGLLKYDQDNDLVGDIATGYKVNNTATVYTLKLREDVYWHDGKQLTSKDVAFTFNSIQLADAKSPLRSQWQKVKIQTKGKFTVIFTLPHSLASFPHSLTTGIVPEHLLNNIPASRLRSVEFNTVSPVGTGPFRWRTIEVEGNNPETRQERIGLARNDNYYNGAPMLERFVVRAFNNIEELKRSFSNGELTAVSGLETIDDDLRPAVKNNYDIPLMAQVSVFLNNSNQLLSNTKLRQALVYATDTDKIIKNLDHTVVKSDSILLKKHLGYNPKINQLEFNKAKANKILDQSGWKKTDSDGIRTNGKKQLSLTLYSKDTKDYSLIASMLQQQWRDVGVKLDVKLQSSEDLESVIAFHNYDILLYGISLGNDPDIYAYWHSSQADVSSGSRLNLSEYKSTTVDQALEGGRSRSDPKIRAIKYQPMLSGYRDDAPAISLYQPGLLYLTSRDVYNFNPSIIAVPTGRFANVENWSIRQTRINKL